MSNTVIYTGISDSRSAKVISDLIESGRQCLIIVSGKNRAETLERDLSFFCSRNLTRLNAVEDVFLNYEARNNDQRILGLKAMNAFKTDPEAVVIAPVTAAVKRLEPPEYYESSSFSLATGETADQDEVRRALADTGYERADTVTARGQFSARGGITDFFPPDADYPVRVEFFGDEVDSIRNFDPETQRSVASLKKTDVFPAQQIARGGELIERGAAKIREVYDAQAERLSKKGSEYSEAVEKLAERRDELIDYLENVSETALFENYIQYFYDKTAYIWDYMKDGIVIIDDPARVSEHLELRKKELINDFDILLERGKAVPEDAALITDEKDLLDVFDKRDSFLLMPFDTKAPGTDRASRKVNISSHQMMLFGGHMDVLKKEISSYLSRGFAVTIAASSKERAEALSGFVDDSELGRDSGKISVREGYLSHGMDFPDEKLCYISDNDIFDSSKFVRRRKKHRSGKPLDSFADLNEGDYVVHENHGIGRFIGIEPIKVDGQTRDYLKIKYAGTDILYVPVEQMDVVQKYIGSDAVAPKLNKLSGDEWKNAKSRARASIADMTEELMTLYGKRMTEKGYAFAPDTEWQREFEASFPYEETDDQLRSVDEIKRDMEKPVPMDRLLCGDVGYGKTEVAERAIFKCLIEGKQAAVLVPTTILAAQHYETFKERFAKYPFTIELMSRFRSDSEMKKVADGLRIGSVDLVVGTHRLLSNDVKFKDLGLLVIDEEHRFGVAHKEKIKEMKTNVDVLTLSATPIPRTLNMSLSGIKDMSLITEPPAERYPVQTYVTEEDDSLIRQVILREMDRGGQTFVVYNRVRGIKRVAERISSLVPEAKIAVGHGQMNERALEEVMRDFIEGKTDVLVATTIIESGIDIPNANTVIILDADKCGLAQLYQLRGRVGRSDRIAYAYLMYRKQKVLTEVAEKRLKAIKEFTEFGSGFKIAMRDMEIRGAGNILGAEQSGHMSEIGYEMYLKLVDDAVRRAKGEPVPEIPEDIKVEIKSNANIPDSYISSETLKLQMYKKIASIENADDERDVTDELIDRFGDIPDETLNLIKISRIRSDSEKLGLKSVTESAGKVLVSFGKESSLTPYGIAKVSERFGNKILFYGGTEPNIRLSAGESEKLGELEELLDILVEYKDKRH
ncbi:MAG: transcription-repair coupling factor [Eubacterium sp.]|jgi:transcription-repair coupling factor (superfamily II helicase)